MRQVSVFCQCWLVTPPNQIHAIQEALFLLQHALAINISQRTIRVIFFLESFVDRLVVHPPELFCREVRIRIQRLHAAKRYRLFLDLTVVVTRREFFSAAYHIPETEVDIKFFRVHAIELEFHVLVVSARGAYPCRQETDEIVIKREKPRRVLNGNLNILDYRLNMNAGKFV